jgi:predicted N-acetyltransferase YhbS
MEAPLVTIRPELESDHAQREALLDRAFGRSRNRKTSERLRQGRRPSPGLAFSAVDAESRLAGSIRLWDVVAGAAGAALLLGPLAVDHRWRKRGIGKALMAHALAEAKARGHGAVLLVGDAPYYGRFGFSGAAVADLHLPGRPVECHRFLGLELRAGGLAGAEGLVIASGRREQVKRKAA